MTGSAAGRHPSRGRTLRRIAGSTLAVVPVGVLLHYVYDWTGNHPAAGVFSALNESTWEHLKLAFWPMLAIAPLQRRLYDDPPGWLPATAARTLGAPLLIILLFYGYTAVLGTHHLPLDLAVFVLAVLGGETLGHLLMPRRFPPRARAAAAAAVVLTAAAMVAFSFRPPRWFLFEPPQ